MGSGKALFDGFSGWRISDFGCSETSRNQKLPAAWCLQHKICWVIERLIRQVGHGVMCR